MSRLLAHTPSDPNCLAIVGTDIPLLLRLSIPNRPIYKVDVLVLSHIISR